MDDLDLAYALKPRKQQDKEPTVTMTTGTAVADSKDGFVKVNVGGHVVGDEQALVIATTVAVKAGDIVRVELYGTSGKTPTVTGVVGGGDKQQAEITNAQQQAEQAVQDAMQAKQTAQETKDVAMQAKDIAQATSQHFWSDGDGVHVSSEVQKPDGEVNTLWNSFGLLIRKQLNNLLALTSSGLSIYDGKGNEADNIVAQFRSNEIQLGQAHRKGRQLASSIISLLGGAGKIEYVDNPKFGQDALTISSQAALELKSEQQTSVTSASTYVYGSGLVSLGTQTSSMTLQNDRCTADIEPPISLKSKGGISFTVPDGEKFLYNGNEVATTTDLVDVLASNTWPANIIKAYARGNTVTVSVSRANNGNASSTTAGFVIGRIKDGYFPPNEVYQLVGIQSGAWLQLIIRTNGEIVLRHIYSDKQLWWSEYEGTITYTI